MHDSDGLMNHDDTDEHEVRVEDSVASMLRVRRAIVVDSSTCRQLLALR